MSNYFHLVHVGRFGDRDDNRDNGGGWGRSNDTDDGYRRRFDSMYYSRTLSSFQTYMN